jgi:predicted Rossmann fold nucleotide-binding protein DprA/Smf involved in DNA uptake
VTDPSGQNNSDRWEYPGRGYSDGCRKQSRRDGNDQENHREPPRQKREIISAKDCENMIRRLESGEPDYPTILRDRLGDAAPRSLYALGDMAIIRNRLLGLVCSIRCPGSIVIKTFDAIREVRDAGVVVIGGFHAPMERQCLDILLRGNQSVILCAAKGLPGLRLGKDARRAISESRLLVISPFDQSSRRTTAVQAVQRNDLVAALADVVWVPHAVPGGKTWGTIRRTLDRGQKVYTFADKENSELIELGAQPLTADGVTNRLSLATMGINRTGT